MRSALQTLAALGVEGKKIVVVADMLELGLKAGALHQAVGVQAARSSVDVLITVGKLARYIAVGARAENKAMKIFACREADEAQGHLARVFSNGDAVLVKGSRRMKMEQVVEFLLASPKSSLT